MHVPLSPGAVASAFESSGSSGSTMPLVDPVKRPSLALTSTDRVSGHWHISCYFLAYHKYAVDVLKA